MSTALPFFTADDVRRLLPLDAAMDAVDAALVGVPIDTARSTADAERIDGDAVHAEQGIDPENDGPRLFAPAPGGEFLLMPAQGPAFSGLKALTIAPENPARGLEKIQGLYILYSSDTLAPVAVMEGASLTAIRTPAITVSAVRRLAALAPAGDELPADPRVLVFGAGVQAASHIRAAALAFPGASFEVIGRRPERVEALLDSLLDAEETAGREILAVPAGDGSAAAAVAAADVIICVTSTSAPLFDGSLVRDGAIVAAAGTHGLEMREIDDALVARADLVVEGRASAQRENGNLVSLSEADWQGGRPVANLRDLARGEFARTPGRPAFYTGVGMSWEDLVCATAVFNAGGNTVAPN